MNLLIVDDEVITIKGMMNGIDWKECGIDGNVWTACDVNMALQILNAQQVDIMLCDIEMPAASGIDLLQTVRQENKEIACIFLTCHAKFEYAKEAVSLGCKDYILKPAPYEVIADSVKRICGELVENRHQKEMVKYSMDWIQQKEEESGQLQKEKRCPEEAVKETEEYIRKHLDEETLSLPEIAKNSYMNKDYLNRIFKKEKGISINQYIIKERMKLAAFLLENPKLSVNAIAEQTGYGNYPYFISSFKRYFSCTPSQYREKNIRL